VQGLHRRRRETVRSQQRRFLGYLRRRALQLSRCEQVSG